MAQRFRPRIYKRKQRQPNSYMRIGSVENKPKGMGLVEMTQENGQRTKRFGTGTENLPDYAQLSPREETSRASKLPEWERVKNPEDMSRQGRAAYDDATSGGAEVVRGIDDGDVAIFGSRSPRLGGGRPESASGKATPEEKEAAVTDAGREDTPQELPDLPGQASKADVLPPASGGGRGLVTKDEAARRRPLLETMSNKELKRAVGNRPQTQNNIIAAGEKTTPEPETGSAQRRGRGLPPPPQRPTQEPVGLVDSAADDQLARWRRKYGQGGPGLRTNESQRRWEENRNRMRTRVARDQARQEQRAYEADVQAYGSLVDAAQRQQATETEAETQRDIAGKKAEIAREAMEQGSGQGGGANIMKVPGGGLVVQGENLEYIPEARPQQEGKMGPIFDNEGYQVGTQYSTFNPQTGQWQHGGGGQSEPAEIRELRGEIDAHMTQIAGKDDRHGFANIFSRKGAITDKLAKLNRLERQYGLPVTRMPAGTLDDVRERGAVPSLVDNRYQFGGGQQQATGSQRGGGQMAYVKDPESGEIRAIPREKFSATIGRGGVEVDEAEAEKFARRKRLNDALKRGGAEQYMVPNR